MAGARRQVSQPSPPNSRSASMRAVVIMPRSPTITISRSPNLVRTTSTACTNAVGSAVLPGNTRTATGRPSGSVSSQYSICAFALLAVAGVAARRQRAVRAFHPRGGAGRSRPSGPGSDAGARCRAASFASMLSCRANSQSNAAYTSSVDAAATPRSAPRLVSSHHASVASLLAGRSTREMISARARSRSRQAGPSRPRQPERLGLRPHGGHMPVRQRAGHRHRRRGGHERLPLQRAGDHLDQLAGQVRQVASVSCRTAPPSR